MQTSEAKRHWLYIFLGMAFMIVGIALIVLKFAMIELMMELFSVYIAFSACVRVWEILKGKKYSASTRDRTFQFFVAVALFWIAALVFIFRDDSALWLVRIVGSYQLLMAFINFISFYLMRSDQAPERYNRFIFAMVHLVMGLGSLIANDQGENAIIRIGIYTILVGMTYIHDGRAVIIDPDREYELRRTIRIPLPAIFSAFLPQGLIQKINRLIAGETDKFDEEMIKDPLFQGNKCDDADETEGKSLLVQIHVGEKEIDIIGHMNVTYDGTVYSYGNHDVDSRRLFDAVGDGVLVLIDHQEYLDFSVQHGTTIVEYEIELNDYQRQSLEQKLTEIRGQLTAWVPQSKRLLNAYAGNLMRNTHAKFYKFKEGQYRTYFVFWTNCVLFSDEILRSTGTDRFPLVGVQTPGTYYDYFEREFSKEPSIIKKRRVFNLDLRDYMAKRLYPMEKKG